MRARKKSVRTYEAVVLDLSQQGPEVRGFSPGYLFTKELIVIGSTLDVLLRAVDTVDGKLPALSSNARFSDLTKLATRNASYIVFADLSGLIGMVVDSLPADTRGDYEDNAGPSLDPFRLLLRGCNLQQ